MPERRSLSGAFSNRMFSPAMRRARVAMKGLPLLRRMASGDIVLTEKVLNRVLAKAGLDEELPLHWETLQVRLREGYFEFDIQGAAAFIHGPVFRVQARFESVEISLERQVICVRLLRDIQTFAHGIVERVLLLFVRAILGRFFQTETLLRTLDRTSGAFTQEEPNLIRIELHKLEPVRRQLDRHLVGAAGAMIGRDTTLVQAIECHQGEMIIRTTTVAREVSGRAVQLGLAAGSRAGQVVGAVRDMGRQLGQDIREELESTRKALEAAQEDEEENPNLLPPET